MENKRSGVLVRFFLLQILASETASNHPYQGEKKIGSRRVALLDEDQVGNEDIVGGVGARSVIICFWVQDLT